MIYITGDTHASFFRIELFCKKFNTSKEDILIILGDAGINYDLGFKAELLKDQLDYLPITLFCIHGNHEERPYLVKNEDGKPLYEEKDMFGGVVYVEKEHPSLIFAKDGEYYHIGNHDYFVIGGAYSIDKFYRLSHGYNWFESEQPNEEIKNRVEKKLKELDYKVDIVLTHTAPLKYEPTEFFIPDLDQSKIDKTTEIWLDKIEDKLDYAHWYFGHYHNYKKIDKMTMLYKEIESIE